MSTVLVNISWKLPLYVFVCFVHRSFELNSLETGNTHVQINTIKQPKMKFPDFFRAAHMEDDNSI